MRGRTLLETIVDMKQQAISNNADEMVLKLDKCGGKLEGWSVYIRVGREQIEEPNE